MATWGDMVSLLLCFFVLLFAMSSIDADRAQQIIISLRGSLGVMRGGTTLAPPDRPNPPEAAQGRDPGPSPQVRLLDTQHVAHTINAFLRTEGLDRAIRVTINQRGVQVSISDQFLFDSGSAMIRPAGQRALYRISELVRDNVPAIAVEGHTDSVPLLGGIYRDNWGLSAMRAAVVASFMQDSGRIEPIRLQAVGYGPTRPVMPNDTPEHRALNRRVDLVMLSQHPMQ
jgi:chemotaxis protein MotB